MNLTLKRYEDGLLARSFVETSVRQLCRVDHGGDENTIQEWATNGWNAFLSATDKYYVVDDHVILGMGAAMRSGEIVTNYVAPEAVGYGVSTKMMSYMEWSAIVDKLRCTRLVSTMTARHFYLKRGYEEFSRPEKGVGNTWNFPMLKRLVA